MRDSGLTGSGAAARASEAGAALFEADGFIEALARKLRRHPKRIVFPDGEDERVVRVAGELVRREAAVPMLVGRANVIRRMAEEAGIELEFVKILDPRHSSDVAVFCRYLTRIERFRGREIENAREVVMQPHYFGAMMIQYGHADGLVGGNLSLPVSVFRPLLQLVKPMPDVPRVFATAILHGAHLPHFGSEGVLYLADCGMNPEPSISELAAIAVEAGKLARIHLGRRPRVALVSHSTMGSSHLPAAERVRAATELARQRADGNEVRIDGELQVDVALVPEAAEIKLSHVSAQQPADVLVFPNLDAAHVALKLLQHVAGARVFGPLVCGLGRPAAQVPRTVSAESLLGTALAVGVEAIKFHQLYPDGEV